MSTISIHLMFLLIEGKEYEKAIYPDHFNTSHVSINQRIRILQTGLTRISIHLMFLLIQTDLQIVLPACDISIHLMFLLINIPARSLRPSFCDFNTSHVSINPELIRIPGDMNSDFNTSHVSINRRSPSSVACRSQNFNTSHVSINPRGRSPGCSIPDAFQYISCFY